MSNETDQPATTASAVVPTTALPAVSQAPTYDEAFPSLGGGSAPAPGGAWTNTAAGLKRIKCSELSITFQITFAERRFRPGTTTEFGKGATADRGKAECFKIMHETNTKIEYSQRKDNSIVVIITGKQSNLNEAKKLVLANLTQQGSIDVSIPKAHHRFVLGKGAEILKKIQDQTGAKISVPKVEDTDPLIRVTGSKEAMEAARKKIEQISLEQSGRHRETLEADIWIHPFIRGGHDSNIDALKKKYGIVALDIPPPSANKTEIVVRGPENAAILCAKELKALIEQKRKNCQCIKINVDQKQHRFVIGKAGKNIQDVLRDTGVSVEVPSQDTNSDVITLRGEQHQMGTALNQVYANASSHQDAVIPADEWMHRLLIGQKGATVREISDKYGNGKVNINFSNAGIELEGTPSELEAVKTELERRIADIKMTTSHMEIAVPSQYHSHLIGKGGSNLTKLKDDFGVQIKIPQETDKSDKITIEGPPEGVKQAQLQLEALAKKIADEASDYIFLNRRFHRQLIGAGGENIKKLREQYPNVQISIPEEKSKSDQITLRGPSKELADAIVQVKKIARDLEEKGYRIEVPILKQYHRNIIGKAGAQIKKIRDETNCQIELPKENTDSEIIAIIGRKADAEKARKMIREIEKDLVQITEEEVTIESKLHQALIGAGGKRVKELQGEDAIIHFPSDGKSDVVTIRGKDGAVKAAKIALLDEAAALRLQSFSATVNAAPEYHRFLIGRGGSNMKEIRDQTGCRIAVPGPNDDKQDVITILGTQSGVKKAKDILEKMVTELALIEEKEVTVPEKYHKNFTARRAELINKIASDCGGVQISFPRPPKEGEPSSVLVKVKGPGNCVDEAIAMINECTEDMIAQVTEEMEIDKSYHGDIIGKGGKQVQELQTEYNVQIKFPSKEQDENVNIIHITGRKEKIDEARAAMMALIPVTNEYPLDATFHSELIGQRGSGLQELTKEFNINIKVPQKPLDGEDPINFITLVGKAELVEQVVVLLDEKKKVWEANAEDRRLRNHTEVLEVDPIFHPKIIGPKGDQINKLRQEHDVRVNFPKEKDDEKITIQGYPDKVAAMKEAILKIVAELEAHVVQDVLISQRIHPRIIGTRGSGVRRIMKDHGVEIKIGRSPAQPDKVSVIGAVENVEGCIDYLLNLEEEILQELADREDDDRYIPSQQKFNKEKKKDSKNSSNGFQVKNAPWSLGAESFPTLGGQNGSSGGASSWGPKK